MQMKGKHDEIITNFFGGLQRDMPNEFHQKVSGYCLIYAPYYILMLESDDTDFLDFVLREIQNTVGKTIHEQVWCLLYTEEVSLSLPLSYPSSSG